MPYWSSSLDEHGVNLIYKNNEVIETTKGLRLNYQSEKLRQYEVKWWQRVNPVQWIQHAKLSNKMSNPKASINLGAPVTKLSKLDGRSKPLAAIWGNWVLSENFNLMGEVGGHTNIPLLICPEHAVETSCLPENDGDILQLADSNTAASLNALPQLRRKHVMFVKP